LVRGKREETYHVVTGGLVDGKVGDADHGDEDQRRDPVDLGRAERGPGEGEEADGFEEDEPQEALHAALGLDAVLAASSLHLLAVVDVEGDEEDAGQDVSDEETVVMLVYIVNIRKGSW
jgi:hypothetical protein